MFNFVFGPAGSGKTTFAYNKIVDLCKSGNSKVMMLVPEQSSFSTKSAILDILGPQIYEKVSIFSFTRLSEYVFEYVGVKRENVIDDGIRNILMSIAFEQLQDVISFFSGKSKKKAVINLMVHSLKECKKDNITPEMLNNVASNLKEKTLKDKLKETALILDTYEALISETYIDPLDDISKLTEILSQTNLFEDYTVIVDSFSGFTNQQLEIIKILIKQSKDFYVTVNIDANNRYLDVFSTPNNTISDLKSILRSLQIEKSEDIILTDFHRSDKQDLTFLRNNVFSVSNDKYEGNPENIITFAADNEYQEAQFVANNIKKLVMEDNYKFSDIAIITRDSKKYDGILDVILEKNNIAFFGDYSKNILVSPIIRFIFNAIDSVVKNFDRDSILSMMKTGLLELSPYSIAEFENYLFVWNINTKEFKNEFKNNPSGFENWREENKKQLEKIEATRQLIVTPLEDFKSATKSATGLEICKSIYKLLTDFSVDNSIKKLAKKLENQGLIFEGNELVRTYNLIITSLEKMVAIVGDKRIDLKDFREYFEYLISNINLSDIPRYQDQVQVGTAERIRLNDVKAVFIMGAVEGEFPAIPKTGGIFSESERRLLIENDIPFKDSLEELSCHEKYLIYCGLTAAKEKLFVSCHISDFSGNSYEPSIIFEEINRIFPDNKSFSSSDINEFNDIWSENQAFNVLAKNFYENTGEISVIKSYFENKNLYNHRLELISSFLENKPFGIKNKELAEKLFKKNMNISASRVEKFNLCPFQYFCSYGMNTKERKTASIDAMQFGNIVHYFLEKFLVKYNKEILNELTDEEIKISIDEILSDFASENLGGIENKSKSFLNLYNRLKRNIFNLIKAIIRQFEYCDFIPCDFELEIGKSGEIPPYKVVIDEEHSVSINGFVDRVDVLPKNDDEMYVRIVDYKTGNKTFTLSEIMYGINLQMLIYLRAITANGEVYYKKKMIPTGILYMPSFTTEISAQKGITQDELIKKLDYNFKMNGLILNDKNVIESMDRKGDFIKLPKKTAECMYSENIADLHQFDEIFSHIDEVIKNMANELYNGSVPAKPLKGEINGCQYCPYDSVCNKRDNGQYRFTDKLSAQTVYETLGKEKL